MIVECKYWQSTIIMWILLFHLLRDFTISFTFVSLKEYFRNRDRLNDYRVPKLSSFILTYNVTKRFGTFETNSSFSTIFCCKSHKVKTRCDTNNTLLKEDWNWKPCFCRKASLADVVDLVVRVSKCELRIGLHYSNFIEYSCQ